MTRTVQPCGNGDWLCQREMAIFDHCRIDPLQPPPKNLSEMIMLATPTALQNLVHIRPRGLLVEWVKYNQIFFIYLYPSLGTHLQVRCIDGFLRLLFWVPL